MPVAGVEMVFGCVIVLLNTYDGCHVAGVVRERGTPYNGCMVSRTSSGILPASLHVQASGIPPTIVFPSKIRFHSPGPGDQRGE